MSENNFEKQDTKAIRTQKNEFLKKTAEYRPDLFRYCRKLTNSPWDAEDLVQETLMVAYGRLADKHAGILNVKSYLFKMATNQWINWCRRKKLQFEYSSAELEPIYEEKIYFTHDSLAVLLNYLPPKERVSFVLSEVFESNNEEIAEIMGNTEGAVKSALSRAREKVSHLSLNSKSINAKLDTKNNTILNLAVEAFNRRDINDFAKLFATNAVGNAPGCFFETGVEEIKKGSLFYTINTHEGQPQPATMRACEITVHGESLFAIFDGNKLDDIWKFTFEDDEIIRFDCFYCCPDVLEEVGELLNVQSNRHGYWFEQG